MNIIKKHFYKKVLKAIEKISILLGQGFIVAFIIDIIMNGMVFGVGSISHIILSSIMAAFSMCIIILAVLYYKIDKGLL